MSNEVTELSASLVVNVPVSDPAFADPSTVVLNVVLDKVNVTLADAALNEASTRAVASVISRIRIILHL